MNLRTDHQEPAGIGGGTVKRCVDVGLSLAAVILLSPIWLCTAMAVAVETGRPVLFRQRRVGLAGREFDMFKFRSMVTDASNLGPYITALNDPRITRVGQIIRRTSLDELPQLVNVLMGDMSLVGPRPDVPAQRANYNEADWIVRCSVRPGITGLSQALYRSDSSATERLQADLRYVREQSLWLDLKIMWWTFKRLSGQGAN